MIAWSLRMDGANPGNEGGRASASARVERRATDAHREVLARLFVVAAIIAALMMAVKARGQTAPAGNDHPHSEMLSSARMPNPFGEPARTPAMDTEQKYAFAKRVNIEPLRDLAIQHNNRIKIIDTLAREVMGSMVGRSSYYDLRTGADGSALRLRYDPLFTFLDMVIDPMYYVDRPVVAINYLPLRDEFLDRLFKPGTDEWEGWRRVGRLTPRQVYMNFNDVAGAPGSMAEPMMKGLNGVHESLQLFNGIESNLLMVPAASSGEPWGHLGGIDAGSTAGKALRSMGEAWRKGDAQGVNAAAQVLAAELPKMNPEVYPTTKRSIERAYNATNPFEYGYWFYAGSLLTLLLSFGTQRKWLLWTGITFLSLGLAMHAFGFAARCLIAERFAIQNQFESMTGVSLFAALVGAVLAIFRRQAIFATAASAVGFMVLIAATQMGIPGYNIEREAAILNTSVLLKYHVTTVLVSYGLISLGMIVSLFYLGTHYYARSRALAPVRAASLELPRGAQLAGVGGAGLGGLASADRKSVV